MGGIPLFAQLLGTPGVKQAVTGRGKMSEPSSSFLS
jgi:hypothetical protein